jgi:hypothetical protein
MQQILEAKLEMLSVGYFKRITKEKLSFKMVIMGVSIFDVKVERPMENQ